VPAYDRNLTITAVEGFASRRVVDYSEMGVTFEWLTTSGAGSMRVTMLQGTPFLTARFAGVTPVVTQHVASPLISGLGNGMVGKSFKVRGWEEEARPPMSAGWGRGVWWLAVAVSHLETERHWWWLVASRGRHAASPMRF
jgi:hypothetical protein